MRLAYRNYIKETYIGTYIIVFMYFRWKYRRNNRSGLKIPLEILIENIFDCGFRISLSVERLLKISHQFNIRIFIYN